ncbi:MAG: LysR family transcriptional regulator [Burkholderiales bacterium]
MSSIGLQGLTAFAQTVQQGSFAAAARELGLTPSAVAKSVARLEADLGLKLLHRTTREVSLTSDGRSLAERCRRVVDEIDALRSDAEGARGEPAGTLRVTAPITFGKRVLVPRIAALVARHPRLAVDLVLSDRYADLVKEGLDAAVRVGVLPDSSFVARRIAQQQLVFVASPAYLAQHGRPASPAQLAGHRCLAFRLPTSGRLRPWEFARNGRVVTATPEARIVMNDGEAIVAAALADAGIAQVPGYMAEDALASGALVEIIKAHRPPALPISLVYAGGRLVTPRLRALVDALTARSASRR